MISAIKYIRKILNKGQKVRILIIVFLMIIGGALETLGVTLIVPLMTTIMQDGFFDTNSFVRLFCKHMRIKDQTSFIATVFILLIIIFVVKNLFVYFEYYVQAKFICNNKQETQVRIMRAMLSKPYEYFINSSVGEMTRVVTSDVLSTYSMIATLMSLLTEAVVSAFLVVAIFIIEPQISGLMAVTLFAEMILIHKVIKPVLKKAGADHMIAEAKSNKWIIQAFTGVKDVKINAKEDYFTNRYGVWSKKAVEQERVNTVLSNAPRMIIESVTVAVALGAMTIFIILGRDVSTILPQLSAFAVAAVRLMPSANRIVTAVNSMSFNEKALASVADNLANANGNDNNACLSSTMQDNYEITLNDKCELRDIVFCYCDSKKPVLNKASMIIPVGKSVGIIGTSGAGKTTAVDVLIGLLNNQEGEVLSDGVSVQGKISDWLQMIGYIPQNTYMIDDTIGANVAFGIAEAEIDENRIIESLKEAMLYDYVMSLPDGIHTVIGDHGVRLSGGQRQRVGIARALYANPKLLIFDEATSSLDNETEAAIMESINSLHGKKTMIIIAHRLSTIEGCDIVYKVIDGKIECIRR